jgi:hypothetical protein
MLKSGTLLWNRQHLSFTSLETRDIDTGLTQSNLALANDPPLGIPGPAAPAPGETPASRVHVIPMAPIGAWSNITHGEPYYNTTTGTVHVVFTNGLESNVTDLNVLFWDPHTSISPGDAATYNVDNR